MIKIKFLARKFLYYFSPLSTFKGKEKDPNPDLYLEITDTDADPGGPKTYGSHGSGSISGSRTLV